MSKEWMNAPLPPLSQSIIASGLMGGDYSIAKVPNTPKKKPRSSSTINMAAVKKSIPTTMSQRPKQANKDDSDILIEKDALSHSSAKTSRLPTNIHFSSTSCSPTRKKQIKSRRPIEQYHIYTQEERDQIYHHENVNKTPEKINIDYLSNSSRLKSDRLISSDTCRINFKEETNEIITELDKNISSIFPNIDKLDINTLPIEKQSEIKSKLLQYYNFSFNKLILQERPLCTERALLMRRFHIFYNQLFGDIPSLMNKIQIFSNEQTQKYNSLLEYSQKVESNTNDIKTENENLKSQLETLQKKIESITAHSNQKDIEMSTNSFDLDMVKYQVSQCQFKLQAKKEKVKALKNSIEKLEEQNKTQLIQIENLTKTINELKLGDTGYLALYHRALEENEKLASKIKSLEKVNFDITHIEKVDIEIQNDLNEQTNSPQPNSQPTTAKKGQRESNTPVQMTIPPMLIKRSRRKSAAVIPRNFIPTVEKPPTDKDLEGQKSDSINPSNSTAHTFSKTQPISIQNNCEEPIQKVDQSTQSSQEDITDKLVKPASRVDVGIQATLAETSAKSDAKEKEIQNSKENDNKYTQFQTPNHYSIDHSKIDSLPDIFEMIMPLLSQPCMKSSEQDLKVINPSAYSNRKSDKPIFWAIQLIHCFLTDSFVLSLKNESQNSTESIFVEWLSRQYNLPHLVQQVICDFSYILLNNRTKVPHLLFFAEVLMGKYSFSQLCFLSTLYTFSYEFTFPDINSFIQSSEQCIEKEPMIHIDCIHKIINKCFSKEITEDFIEKEFSACFKAKNPLVSYIQFLCKSTDLFGEKHQLLHMKSKDLLLLCGCCDSMGISYDCFVKFFSLLGFGSNRIEKNVNFNESSFDFKNEWKRSIKKTEFCENRQDVTLLRLTGILSICAEKKKPLICIIEIGSLKASLTRIKNLSSFVLDFYYDLQSKFANLLPKIFEKLNPQILKKIAVYYEKLRKELVRADISTIVYAYRMILNKIDRLLMKEKGFIPFNTNCKIEVISKLIEYMDRTESVSFALIE